MTASSFHSLSLIFFLSQTHNSAAVLSQTQYLLAMLLGDKDFTRRYVAKNKRRIKERHDRLVEGLKEIGIGCLESNAGLFCWVNMSHLMRSRSFEGEMELWKKVVFEVGRSRWSRGKSPAPKGPSSARLLLPRSRKTPLEQLGQYLPEPLIARFGSLRPLWKLCVQLDPVSPSFFF